MEDDIVGEVYITEKIAESQGDPKSYHEAVNRSNEAAQWLLAMEEEYQSLIKNGTWILVEAPAGVNIVGCRWVFKTKRNERGEVVRFKARLVAKGFTQVLGQDYTDTFAPVSRMTSIRTFLSIAAEEDWELESLDVDTAFLNADIDETVYMQQPQGFEVIVPDGNKQVCLLKKSIYGLKQASHNWNRL
jgi:hypothetical protein